MIKGELYSYTTTFSPEKIVVGFPVPFTIALVKLLTGDLAGKTLTAQLTELEYEERESVRVIPIPNGLIEVPVKERWPILEIGMECEMVTRKLRESEDEREE